MPSCVLLCYRVEAGVKRLAELNPHVSVKYIERKFDKVNGSWSFLSEYKVVMTGIEL